MLVSAPEGIEIVSARTLVLACGAHDGALAFEGNDVPGVMSARAAGWLLDRGVIVGERIAVVVPPGGGPFGLPFARAAAAHAKVEVVHGEPLAVRGASGAKGVRVRTAKGDRTLDADAVLIDAPRSPAYELAEQAGAKLVHQPSGFVVADPFIADGIWAAGELVGTPFEAKAISESARALAERMA